MPAIANAEPPEKRELKKKKEELKSLEQELADKGRGFKPIWPRLWKGIDAPRNKEWKRLNIGWGSCMKEGASMDVETAQKWYRQAAEQGYLLALGALKKISHQKSIYPELTQL